MYIRVPLEDGHEFENGEEFLVDVGPAGAGVVRAGRTDVAIKSAGETFEASLGRVRSMAAMLVEQLSGFPAAPDHIRAEFGISLALETGMVVVKGTGEAHFVIELEWSRKQGD